MSVDITDIGKYSMSPATMISTLGYSKSLFDDNGTRVKFSTDLETLPNVETQEVAVDVKPFWGDETNFEIGITRQDFKVRAQLVTSFTVFGAAFTNDAPESRYSKFNDGNSFNLYRATDDANRTVSIGTKKSGNVNINLVRLKSEVAESAVGSQISPDANMNIWQNGTFNTSKDYELVDSSQYTLLADSGNFVVVAPCNRRKVITDEFGNEVVVDNSDPNGVYTECRAFVTFEITKDPNVPITAPFGATRVRFKIPQFATANQTFTQETNAPTTARSEAWRKQHYLFKGNEFYSVSKYHGLYYRDQGGPGSDTRNDPSLPRDPFWNVGILCTQNSRVANNQATGFWQNVPFNPLSQQQGNFGAEYLNFCLFFDVYGWSNGDQNASVNFNLTDNDQSYYYVNDGNNTQVIGGGLRGTIYFQRSDQHKSSFVNVPKADIQNIITNSPNLKGFTNLTPPFNSNLLLGNYIGTTATKYFYRGINASDCIRFLVDLGLVNF